MVDCASLPSVHVLHSYRDTQCRGEGSDVDVVALVVHWLHLLSCVEVGERKRVSE